MANRQIYQLGTKTLNTTDVLATQLNNGAEEAGKNTIQDILDLVPTPVAGPGIAVNGLEITASVLSVNGIYPTDGNIQTSLTATKTGLSSSLIASSSGAVTASLQDGLIWIVAGETGPTSGSNGEVYVYASSSVGAWYSVASTDQAANDARYLMLTPQSPLAGALNLGGQNLTNGATITATTFVGTASWADNATNAVTASYILQAVSASYATTASYVVNASTASYVSASSIDGTVANATTAATASYVNTLTQNVTVVGGVTVSGSISTSGSIALTNLLQGDNGTTVQNLTAGNLTIGSADLSGSFANRILPLGYSSYNIYFNESSGGNNYLRIQTAAGGARSFTGPITIAAQGGSSLTTLRYGTSTTITTISENEWVTLRGQGAAWSVLTRGRVDETLISKGAVGATQNITGSLGILGTLTVSAGITGTASWATNAQTASYVENAVSASYATTASYVTTAQTASYVLQAVSSSFATTSSYALTTANIFTSNLTVSGSFITTGSLSVIGTATITSASVQGTIISNIGDTFTGTAAVTKIVTLSSAEYSGLGSKDANTLYVVI